MKPRLIRPTDAEDAAITAAALSDPDNPPLTDAELAQFKRIRKRGGKGQHVVPHGGDWAVRGAGNERVTSVHPTQAEAIARAREIARNQGSELVIHDEDGKIREKIRTWPRSRKTAA